MTTTNDTNASDFDTGGTGTGGDTSMHAGNHTGNGPATTMTGGASSEQIHAAQKKKSANLLIIGIAALGLFAVAGFVIYSNFLVPHKQLHPVAMPPITNSASTVSVIPTPGVNANGSTPALPGATPNTGPQTLGQTPTSSSLGQSPGTNPSLGSGLDTSSATTPTSGLNAQPANTGVSTGIGAGNTAGTNPTIPAGSSGSVNANKDALSAFQSNNPSTSAIAPVAPASVPVVDNTPPVSGNLESRVSNLENRMSTVENEIAKLEKKEFAQIGSRMKHVQKKVWSMGKTSTQKRVKRNHQEVKVPQVLTPSVLNPNPTAFKSEIAPIEPELKNEVVVYQDEQASVSSTSSTMNNNTGSDGTDVMFVKGNGSSSAVNNLPSPEENGSVSSNKIQAIIPGRVWLRASSGISVSYVVGDTLENGKTVVAIDADHATVSLNDGTVIN